MTLVEVLTGLTAEFTGTVGVWARSLQTDELLSFGAAEEPYPSASTIKLAIFYELHRQAAAGLVDLDQPRTMTAEDVVPGSGVLKDLSPGIQLPIRDLATLMMTVSDNTATNLCIDAIGLDSVNRAMDDLELPGVRLYNKIFRPQPGRPGNQAVPTQLGTLMDHIARHQVLTPAVCKAMLRVMERAQNPLCRRFLPEVTAANETGGEDGLVIAAKYGSINGCRHEVGLVRTGEHGYVFSIMTKGCKDLRWVEENEGQLLVSKIAAALHQHFTAAKA